MDCIFCKIINKEIPAAIVFEDAKTLAFLDVRPLAKGHTLVIPKNHVENIFDIAPDDIAAVAVTAKTISQKISANLKTDGINLVQSNGAHAGQEVPHFHLHIVPRYHGDGIVGNWGHKSTQSADPVELKTVAQHIIG